MSALNCGIDEYLLPTIMWMYVEITLTQLSRGVLNEYGRKWESELMEAFCFVVTCAHCKHTPFW